jgi:hypothetical protein
LAERDQLREKFGPDYLTNAEALQAMEYLEKCIYETIRLAQRSITLRLVKKPLTITEVLRGLRNHETVIFRNDVASL